MRPEVEKLVKLGKLPRYDEDSDEYWKEFEETLHSIQIPTSIEEAQALLNCFHKEEEHTGSGMCETLIELIESSEFFFKEPPDPENIWHVELWEKQQRWLAKQGFDEK